MQERNWFGSDQDNVALCGHAQYNIADLLDDLIVTHVTAHISKQVFLSDDNNSMKAFRYLP